MWEAWGQCRWEVGGGGRAGPPAPGLTLQLCPISLLSGHEALISPLGVPSPVSGERVPQTESQQDRGLEVEEGLTGSGRESTQATGERGWLHGRLACAVTQGPAFRRPRAWLHALLSPS